MLFDELRFQLLRNLLPVCLTSLSAMVSCTAFAASETPHCRYINLKTVPITLDGDRLFVDSKINDQTAHMLLDSGAYHTSLTIDAAQKLGLKLGHARATDGLGGESRGYQTLVDSIFIGPVQGKRYQMPVIGDAPDLSKEADGLVGADFMFQRDLELSVAGRQMKFFVPLDCESDTFLAYWDENASYTRMTEVEPASEGELGDPGRMVTVEINGTKIRAEIDSGAPTSIIDLAAAERAGITISSHGVVKLDGKSGGIGSHVADEWLAPFDTFALGDETIKNVKIKIRDLWGPLESDIGHIDQSEQPEMLLGLDFLKAHRVLFAVSQHRFYFSYLGGPVFEREDPKAAPTKDQRSQTEASNNEKNP